jgi:hypothetical protein
MKAGQKTAKKAPKALRQARKAKTVPLRKAQPTRRRTTRNGMFSTGRGTTAR